MARGNFGDRGRDGYLRNAAVQGERGNDENGYSLRAHVLARPTDTLDILISVDDSHDATCENMFVLVGGALHDGSTDPDVSAWDGPCESERDIRGLSLRADQQIRSEEHTSELQSLMRISYAVFCLKKKH